METSRISPDRAANVPADVLDALGLKPGDEVEWHVSNDVAQLRKKQPIDWAWHAFVSKSLEEEWLSPEDEEAFRDL